MKTFWRCGNDSWSIRVDDSDHPDPDFRPCESCVTIDRAEYLALAFNRYGIEASDAREALRRSVMAAS